jgi:S-DNA-T family DNA segregation ATPase FtsK/SpoIIIE
VSGNDRPDVDRLMANVNSLLTLLGTERFRLGRQWIAEQVGLRDTQEGAVASSARSPLDNVAEAATRAVSKVLSPAQARAAAAILELPAILQPWTSDAWKTWTLDDDQRSRRGAAFAGWLTPAADPNLGPNANFGTDIRVPWFMPLHESWFVTHGELERASAHSFIRSVMLRMLAAVSPGDVRFCVFDPVGLGQSVGDLLDLAEYDADLIGGKVWTTPTDLDARLAELSAHIELVLQKYLRTTYRTIDEFNDAAGEVAEPYRVLVLFDFPTGLSADSAMRLKTIVENGPRCGVFTLISAGSHVQAAYGIDPDQVASSMKRLGLQSHFAQNVDGYQLSLSFEHDVLPDRSDVARRVIDAVGRASNQRIESMVTFEKIFGLYSSVAARGLQPELGGAAVSTRAGDPATWWHGDSTRGLFAPIGQKGARDVAILGLDSGDHSGALLVGRPGSGKSTLVHTYIGGLTSVYGPDELELYLVDFKEGVEFKVYAEAGLPHAVVVAIESDRDFGLSVLQSLQAEISRRAELLRATGGRQAGMQALREATGQKVPRVLLVFDEFQVLFARNDKIGLAAADLLESIIRQGRGFGVHVLLGSQSLAGLDSLGAHVPQLLPVRILLPSTEADARRVLGDANPAGDYLTTHGQGILNGAGGAIEANERFKGAMLAETERFERLHAMRDKADSAGFSRRPKVFEGNALVLLESDDPRRFREDLSAPRGRQLRLRTGASMTVGDSGDIVLRREAGAHVLAIVRNGENDTAVPERAAGPAYGLIAAAVASAAMTDCYIDIVDFMPVDDGLDALLEPLLEAGRITLRRRRAFADVLESYVFEVAERVDEDDTSREPRLLFLFGVHRARELDSEALGLDVDEDLIEKLERVMRDGPETGVHVWLWSDTVVGASRRLTPRMMREVGWRVAGRMSSDDSHSFLGDGQASDLRESQLVIFNDDRGVSVRTTAFAPPRRDWIVAVLANSIDESKEN